MPLRQGHGGIETDDRKFPSHVEDRLNDSFPDFRIQVVQLGRIIPGHPGPVVAVVDKLFVATSPIYSFEDHGGIAPVEIMILEINSDLSMPGEVRSAKTISRKG